MMLPRRHRHSSTGAVYLVLCLSVVLAAQYSSPLHGGDGKEDPDTRETVQDLRYGVTLYHFFQQQYFDALTEVMAAQQTGSLPNHAAEAQLLRGGMSLSYGMDREAKRVFESTLDKAGDQVDRDRAWFYLGKLAWRRGQVAESADALARIDPAYPGVLADEAKYLQAMQALQTGDEAAANMHMQRMESPCPFKPYYFYNLGALRASTANWNAAAQAFRQVSRLACTDSEGAALRDRAFTAAGFCELAAGNTAGAAAEFLAVRLQGPESDRALLGYGWSFANDADYQRALGPWQNLGERPLVTASARESLLAIPYAYEQLNRPRSALEHYREAASRYQAERSRLQLAITRLQEDDLLEIFGLETAVEYAWLGGADPVPGEDTIVYLAHLLSTDSVQVALRELQDLHAIARSLTQAIERLAVLRQVDVEQQRHRQQTIEGGRAAELVQQAGHLREEAARLRALLDHAVAASDGRLLADAVQEARWHRLEQAERKASALQDWQAIRQLQLMRGLMSWQDSEAFADRRWQLQRAMGELEELARQTELGQQRLSDALSAGARPAYDGQIAALEARTRKQRQALAAALQLAQNRLRGSALAELEQQSRQLAFNEGQARLAVARLYDQASPEVPR